jgi:hypothetical protein
MAATGDVPTTDFRFSIASAFCQLPEVANRRQLVRFPAARRHLEFSCGGARGANYGMRRSSPD